MATLNPSAATTLYPKRTDNPLHPANATAFAKALSSERRGQPDGGRVMEVRSKALQREREHIEDILNMAQRALEAAINNTQFGVDTKNTSIGSVSDYFCDLKDDVLHDLDIEIADEAGSLPEIAAE